MTEPTTALIQRLRNEVGQLTHVVHRMTAQRKEMHSDLAAQREAITRALDILERGSISSACDILRAELAHRERTREKRKVK